MRLEEYGRELDDREEVRFEQTCVEIVLTFLWELRREEKHLRRYQLFEKDYEQEGSSLARPLSLSDAKVSDRRPFDKLDEFVITTKARYIVPRPSLSGELPESYEPATAAFRCSFCNRTFDRIFHRNEHEKIKHNVKTDPEHLYTEPFHVRDVARPSIGLII